MKTVYPVIFYATGDERNTYLVDIPNLDGGTEGYGLVDAISMARDYIGGILYSMDESEYPEPSDISSINVTSGKFAEAGPGFISLVDIDMDIYRRKMDTRPVRRNVSLPNWLNTEANNAKINVSRVLQDALIEKLNLA